MVADHTGVDELKVAHSGWLGFLDTYRTLCIAPPKEIHVIFELVKAKGMPVKLAASRDRGCALFTP
jgi:hypothetical protein